MGKKLKVNISRVIKEVEKGLTSRAKNIQHFYTVISALLYVWTNICQDFPGSQFVKTPCFHCRGQGFDLWLVNGDPTCHRAQPKNRKHKNKKQWPTVVAMIFNYLKTFQNILLSREVIWGVFFKKHKNYQHSTFPEICQAPIICNHFSHLWSHLILTTTL